MDEGRVSDKTTRTGGVASGDESADKAGTGEEEPGAARTVCFFLSKRGLNASPGGSKVGGGGLQNAVIVTIFKSPRGT